MTFFDDCYALASLLLPEPHVPYCFIFSKTSHLCATTQPTLIQLSTCSTHCWQYQGLQSLTVTQSVEHNSGTWLPLVTDVVHIKTNCPVVYVIWGGWTGQTKPSTDSKSIILHHQVLFDLCTYICSLAPTLPPILVFFQLSTSFCLISIITNTFIFLFLILTNHHYNLNWSY